MEIQVRVTKILPEERFVSKKSGDEFVKNSFVAETLGQYAKTIKFDVLKSETWEKMAITEGATYDVSFEIESREYNGRYFTSVNAWRADIIANAKAERTKKESKTKQAAASDSEPQPKTPIQTPKNEPKNDDDDSLPF